MATDDPVRTCHADDTDHRGGDGGDPSLCGQCGLHPCSNGTFWCSAACMHTWTSAHSVGESPWPTPGYTETQYAGMRGTPPAPGAWFANTARTAPHPS